MKKKNFQLKWSTLEVKMVDRRLPAPATGLPPALMTGENKILQIVTKWSEMRK